jgi:hypothetical protein
MLPTKDTPPGSRNPSCAGMRRLGRGWRDGSVEILGSVEIM